MTDPNRQGMLDRLRDIADRAAMSVGEIKEKVRDGARAIGLTENKISADEMAARMFGEEVIMRRSRGPMVHTRDAKGKRLPGGVVVEFRNQELVPAITETLVHDPAATRDPTLPEGNIKVWDVTNGSPPLLPGTRSKIAMWIRANSHLYLANGKGRADENSPTRQTDRYLPERGLFIGVLAQQLKPASEASRVNVINPRAAAARVIVGDAGPIASAGVNAVAHAPGAIAETVRTVYDNVKTGIEQVEGAERFGLFEGREEKEKDTGIYSLSFHSARRPEPDREVFRTAEFPASQRYPTKDGVFYVVRIGDIADQLIQLLDDLYQEITGRAPRPLPGAPGQDG